MMVMPANSTHALTHWLAGRYPGRMGLLWSIAKGGRLGTAGPWPPFPGERHTHLPYALDNGAYGCWLRSEPFHADAYRRLLDLVAEQSVRPLWAAVPDVVADAKATEDAWHYWAPVVRHALPGTRLALVLQDGMEPAILDRLRPEALFLGGSTDWKWATAHEWGAIAKARRLPFHVGRVNGYRDLWRADDAGATSCDGTGLSLTDRQRGMMMRYLEESANGTRPAQERIEFAEACDAR